MADRFHLPGPWNGEVLRLEGDEGRHLARVRRIPEGSVVEVFSGDGEIWRVRVESIDKHGVGLRRIEPVEDTRVAPCRLTLATAFAKGDRVDWLVEKATELGVERIVPLLTERSVVDPRTAKLDRLRRVVIEATKQCGRGRLTEIVEPVSWDRFAADAGSGADLLVIAHPGKQRGAARIRAGKGSKVVVAIGPEGGFTDAEIDRARGLGWCPIDLGPTILRIETAAIVATARILAEVESQEELA
ncbi:MAG: RsmE family RNA methyltransferase [Isosphaeraceae bacterium]|nr:RsmE family RNA methyltransferase [Isosphaeraceae bacterium]